METVQQTQVEQPQADTIIFEDLPDATLIHLGNGNFTLVDTDIYFEIYALNWRWKQGRNGLYAFRKSSSGKKYRITFLHRQITNCPGNLHVHHENGNTLDNRLSNLRCLTPQAHRYYHQMQSITKGAK